MQRRTPFLAVVILVIPTLAACGSSTQVAPPPGPLFTTKPGTQAAEGVAYTYQIEAPDPGGTAFSFALPTPPAGAGLSGNTLTSPPTTAQSRIANKFSAPPTHAAATAATHACA